MIASFFDGRVRIRADALKKPENLDMARSLVQARPGVLKVESNARTGSLLVHYDPAVITRETLTGAA
ncbi:MAG: cation transporter, partial [Desulfovibrio sp.]|nr:cation transporter [Desulfovibrio sp.]